jgi:serine/threonine protein kinase/HAMP domain-containing protein
MILLTTPQGQTDLRNMEPSNTNPEQQPQENIAPTGADGEGPAYDDRTRIVPPSMLTSTGIGFTGGLRPPEAGAALEQVGRYQIQGRLGEGAMAVVYKAFDPSINRTLAIKFLRPQLCIDDEYRSRFLREARAAGNLSHNNIATIYDVGEVEGQPYIAMELLDGEPLDDIMDKGTTLPMREVLEIGIQLARALDYAHSRGVIHRDIKPSNLVRLKGTRNIKVTDFGIAHIETREGAQQTRMGSVLGTPQYMSPEQALGQTVDGRSDLFSVGVVLYQLVTGQKPFSGDSLMGLMQSIVKDEPKPPEQWRPDIPPSLRRIIKRCLAKQPDKRFASGGELADALIKVLREVREDTERSKGARIIPLRVRWALLMGLIIAVTMAVTGTIVYNRQHAAMMEQVMDYGASLSKFMATESAVSTLSEDWVAIDVFIQEAMKTQDFHDITVIDHAGRVRVSSNPALVDHPYQRPTGDVVADAHAGVNIFRYADSKGSGVIDFEAPITFQNREIGRVHLGIMERPLNRVARLSLFLMGLLAVVTVLAVIIGSYFIANRYSKPISLLKDSMAEIGRKRFDYRIAEKRNDEFGELYQAFDDMAQALQSDTEQAAQPTAMPPSGGETNEA